MPQGMPLLVGLDFYQALQVLQAAGIYIPKVVIAFTPSQIIVGWVSDTGLPGGFVGAQFPAVNAPVNDGANVLIAVQRFPMASVIDMPPDWKQNVNFMQAVSVGSFITTLSGQNITTLDNTPLETLTTNIAGGEITTLAGADITTLDGTSLVTL